MQVDFKILYWRSWKELNERTYLKYWSLHWSILFGNRGWMSNIARTVAITKSILPDFKVIINHNFTNLYNINLSIKTYTPKVRAICHAAKTYGSSRWFMDRIYSISAFTWSSYSWIWLSPKWPVALLQRGKKLKRQPITTYFIF